jgi:hypothetical protein
MNLKTIESIWQKRFPEHGFDEHGNRLFNNNSDGHKWPFCQHPTLFDRHGGRICSFLGQ